MIEQILNIACQEGQIRELDLHIGLLMARLAERHKLEVGLAAALASAATKEGNVCQPLNDLSPYWSEWDELPTQDPDTWRNRLLHSGVVGKPGETKALILDQNMRLYLYRYHRYEVLIAQNLLQRATPQIKVDIDQATFILKKLFPNDDDEEQKRVAAHALLKSLLIISGGAGTGKTHTVTRILALLQKLAPRPLSIELAAPTGKAAARLRESIQESREKLPDTLTEGLPTQAKTLHRLLGFRPHSNDFKYGKENPLNLDLLVIDEASMVDIVLMESLLKALPPSANLILLGDHNQLPSVEAGRLFADLCGTGKQNWSSELGIQIEELTHTPAPSESKFSSPIDDSFSLLIKNHRQSRESSGILKLSQAVIKGAWNKVEMALNTPGPGLKVEHHIGQNRVDWLNEQVWTACQSMLTSRSVESAFTAMGQFRILCALNDGPAGVSGINQAAEQLLREKHLIPQISKRDYRGKPIIILANDYHLQLFNGDTGILWEDPDDNNRLKAWFRHPENNELYPVSPARLPAHDCAFAITIHKSQGSEYNHVLLLLPEEENRVLSRELLYTGITRARESLTLCADKTILHKMVTTPNSRRSGLKDRLWPRQFTIDR